MKIKDPLAFTDKEARQYKQKMTRLAIRIGKTKNEARRMANNLYQSILDTKKEFDEPKWEGTD